RHRLQPDRLPDAGAGRVEDAARLSHLFTARLRAGICGIESSDDDFIVARFQMLGDVEAKGVIAALVRANLRSIDHDMRFPIDRAEVQEDTLSLPFLGNREGAAVPYRAVDDLPVTGER